MHEPPKSMGKVRPPVQYKQSIMHSCVQQLNHVYIGLTTCIAVAVTQLIENNVCTPLLCARWVLMSSSLQCIHTLRLSELTRQTYSVKTVSTLDLWLHTCTQSLKLIITIQLLLKHLHKYDIGSMTKGNSLLV